MQRVHVLASFLNNVNKQRTMKEEFRSIEGFPSYQVSNLGRIKSLKNNKERILKHTPDYYGYCIVTLCENGTSITKKLHKLVAIAFLNHTPCGYTLVVDHINNNKLNNRVDNLQVISTRHNASKDRPLGTSKYTGVYWNKAAKKWYSNIRINGKCTYLGCFTSEIEASNAYQNKLLTLLQIG